MHTEEHYTTTKDIIRKQSSTNTMGYVDNDSELKKQIKRKTKG